MGATDSNGVYYPDVGETGWGDEVNNDLTLLSSAITAIAAHEAAAADAHDASAVSFTPGGTVAGTDVQTAVLEVATDAAAAQAAHGTESSAHDAANVLFTPTGTIAGTDVQAAVAEVASEAGAALSTHDADTTAVHGIANTAVLETTTGSQAKVDTHLNDTSDAHDASAVSFVPTGTIAATDVQAAIAEVAAEAGASGAPTTADYLVGTAQGALSAEIVVGPTPNGELGGTWGVITVDASHGGGTHAATQAAAEATAASALGTHGTTGHTETSAQYAFTGDISPTAISATQDNYDPTGLSTASTLRLTTNNTTQRNITGLAGGADGRIFIIHNVGPGPVAFIDEGAGSNAANRFALAGDMILLPDSSCFLQYDGTSSRWRMLARATAATNPALTFGTSNAGGTSPYFVRSDDQLALFDATVPSTQAFGDAAAAGAAAVAARRDHKHAMPAAPTTLANDTLAAAKGDLPVATANDAFGILTAPTTRGQALTADEAGNVSWTPQRSAPGGMRIADDMFYGGAAITAIGSVLGPAALGFTGTAAAFTANVLTGTANHPGVGQLSTGTTTTGMARLITGGTGMLLGGGRARYGTWLHIPVVSDGTNRFEVFAGFLDGSSLAAAVDGAFFYYKDSVNSGKWQAITIANSVSTATVTDTGITVAAATFYLLEAEVNAAGTSVTYYINGASVATHAANIPTGTGRETGFGIGILKSLGTTAAGLNIDAYYVELDFTTPR